MHMEEIYGERTLTMCKKFSKRHWITLDYIDGHLENALAIERLLPGQSGRSTGHRMPTWYKGPKGTFTAEEEKTCNVTKSGAV